ncbi:MAG: class A beta-lactamase-related serine hydrolase [Sphingobacteriales bacterium]|nr:MAG: class A beta-lactamase-related serine hydrolase [Sphingobacteriales bacterium]
MKLLKSNLFLTAIFCSLTTLCTAQIKLLSGKEISAAAMDKLLKKEMAAGSIPGLSIAFINKGKIVYSREMGLANIEHNKRVDNKTLFQAASLTKSVFAYYVMQQVEKGLIALDTPLYKYMPYPDIAYDERYKLITARMALTHTTGFPNWRNDGNVPDSLTNIKKGSLYLKFKPGTQVSYSGEGFQYLAKTIAHLLNTDLRGLGQIMNKDVCANLGMTNSTFVRNDYVDQHRATGYLRNDDGTNATTGFESYDELNAAASLRTNAPEFVKFIFALLNNKGLKKQSIKEMLKDQVYDDPLSPASAKGLGVFIYHTSDGDRISHNGNDGNFMADYVLYINKRSGFVFFINNNQEHNIMQHLEYFFKHGEEYPTKDADISIDVNSYVGEYKSSDPTTYNFVFCAEKGRLFLYLKNNPNQKYELHLASKDEFFLTEIVAKLLFNRDAAGQVIEVELEQQTFISDKFKKIK